ncbi:MAG: prepilin-type N-terminal cleavage/methylation domain-containing protein [Deltaproteobacteria bacterium]|nr:prepilin-type N-terminal cleavage/methylation domain-containing protein [Deltaproteobacteria bacterium]
MPNFSVNTSHGLTLLELMIALSIGMIVLGALTSTFILQRKAYNSQEQVIEMTQIARAAMDMIGREVRMAGYFNPENPMQRDNSANPNFVGIPNTIARLEILADLTGDGDTDDENEMIIYTFDSTNNMIRRNTGGGAQPFAENIQGFSFSYFDADDNPAATDEAIRKIRITITARTIKTDPHNPGIGTATLTLTEEVFPRNLSLR